MFWDLLVRSGMALIEFQTGALNRSAIRPSWASARTNPAAPIPLATNTYSGVPFDVPIFDIILQKIIHRAMTVHVRDRAGGGGHEHAKNVGPYYLVSLSG